MSDFLLTQIINYGAPLLGVIVFIGGLGIPLPCTLLVIAAGAFARQGILDWQIASAISIVSVIIGDSLSYSFGFYSREKVLSRFSATPQWLQAEQSFQKWGALSIFFSRFLVTAIALPVNLLSGTTRFAFQKFLVYDILGEVVWIFGYGGLGYLFGSQWEVVNEFLSNFGGVTLGIVFFIFGVRQAWNWNLIRQKA
ncbi:MAG: VTT domain-containing protein [Anaerolineales bacterium]|nr:VTT domain-containing protein [Anaerolineales bacterium]MBX3038042.1 VTT domain-containing protein [Anaerolineales bacterium]